ncbi:hypothetical protein F5X68DRAFT_251171 [Plectosphaerella plurivora]|uniref:Uncharacterized protein n=1 Tax=Plectosphaerella plurivora TaxID=936078 RepID=A0A9P9A5D6_9PEZI|nr:hypothetical protein F5X68DRAFT_251171 [Plectosphaerella plurivora]
MATTLAYNLKLDSHPDPGLTGFQALAYGFHPSSASARYGDENPAQSKRTDEERRSILACFCLSSSIYHKLGTQLMQWTPHMENCLRHVEDFPACENDEVLVIQTKCARILDSICATSSSSFRGSGPVMFPSMHAPMAKAFKGHLDEVQSRVRPQLLEKRLVKYWLLLTNIMILDIELQGPVDPTSSADLLFGRAQLLQSCLTAISHFVENFLSFTPQEHGGLHVHYWLNFIRCLRIVYRLRLAENSAVNGSIVWKTVDLADSLQRGANIWRTVPVAMGLGVDGRNTHTMFAENLLRIKSIWGEALEQAETRRAGDGTSLEMRPDMSQPAFLDDMDAAFDFFDDAWMADVFLPAR